MKSRERERVKSLLIKFTQTVGLVMVFAVVGLFLFSGSASAATTYYVATTGNNENPGTTELPWQTLVYAEATASDGDSVIVAAGTYVVDPGWAGLTLTKAITWTASGSVSLRSNWTTSVINFSGSGATVLDGFILDGDAVNNANNTLSLISANDNSSNKIIRNCSFVNPSSTGYFVRADGANPKTNYTFSGNTFTGTVDIGFKFAGGADDFTIDSSSGTVTANTFYSMPSNTIGDFVITHDNITATIANYYILAWTTGNITYDNNTVTLLGAPINFWYDQQTAATSAVSFQNNNITVTPATSGHVFDMRNKRNITIAGNTININSVLQQMYVFFLQDASSLSATNNTIQTETTLMSDALVYESVGNLSSSCDISNNTFRSKSTSYHTVSVGTENTSAGNNKIDGCTIIGNNFYGASYFDETATTSNHAVLVGFQEQAVVKRNKFFGTGYGAVLKGAAEDYNNTGGFIQNVFTGKLTSAAILCKGAKNVPIYNNTINVTSGAISAAVVHISDNGDGGGVPATGNVVKNNVVNMDVDDYLLKIDDVSKAGTVLSNNSWYATNGKKWNVGGISFGGGTDYTDLDSWQSAGYESNSQFADPLFFDAGNNNLALQSTSPAIDAGTDVSLTTDYLGNPVYGTPDAGAYEYQPPHTMGTNEIDVSAGARVYGNGNFRDKSTVSGTTADLTITPQSGSFSSYGSTEVRPAWMDITNLTWENTGTRHKIWTESSTVVGLTNTIHTVGDLEANKYYNVKVDTVLGQDIDGDDCVSGVCLSNAQGEITFTYTGTYSDHTFDVEEGDNTAPTAAITYSLNSNVKSGESLIITATLNEAMADSPVPKIAISGSNTLAAADMTKTDTTHYFYTHTVGAGDGTATVALSVGTDVVGNVITSAPTSGATFTVDNAAPTFTAQYYSDTELTSSLGVNPKLKTGTYYIKISANEALDSTPTISIAAEGTANDITSGITTLVSGNDYKYTHIISSDAAAVGVAIENFAVTGTDSAGNTSTDVNPTNEGAAAGYTDTVAPTISSISSDKTNGSYKAGEVIDIDLTFSENITTTNTVTVTLETGTTDRTCTFSGVTNAGTATCNYTVQAGDTSADLTVNTVAGTITDQAGNAMVNFAPTTNLAGSKDLVIDTTAPTLSFSDNVASGPVQSDTITADWGDATVKKWDYDTDGTCSNAAGDYSKTDADSITQNTETNNGKYICLYGEDAVGNKDTLVSVNDINIDITAPTGTTLNLGTITASSITASVSGATDANADLHATPYYFDRDAGIATSDWQAGTEWEDNDLTSNTEYSYKVKARDAATSPNESIFTATQSKYTLAPTPTNLSADIVGQTAITLTVDAINNPTAASSGYYFANTTNTTNSGWIQTNTWQDTSLTCGTTYNYTVKYRNGDETETDTIALTQATASCPVAEEDDEVEEEEDDTEDLDISDIDYESTESSITVKWKTNNKADSKVEYGKDRDMNKDEEDDDNEKSHKVVLKNLDPDTLYYFKIKSEDENGSEDSSDRKSIKTKKENAVIKFVNNLFSPADSNNENKEENNNNQNEEENDIINQVNEIPEKIQEKMEEQKFFNTEIFQKNAKKYLSEVKFQLKDEQDNPIPNLAVTLHSDPQTTMTDDQGYATFKDVEVGKHNLAFNYQDANRRFAVNIQEPKTENGEVRMETVVIEAGEKPNVMIYYLAGILIVVIIFLIFKRKKKKESAL